MGKDVIIACDFPSKEDTLAFLDKFTGRKPYVKIGMELFYSEGPAIVKEIKERTPDFSGSEAPRYSKHCRESHGCTVKTGC